MMFITPIQVFISVYCANYTQFAYYQPHLCGNFKAKSSTKFVFYLNSCKFGSFASFNVP